MLCSQALLDFAIIVNLAFLGINQENLTRLQATLLGNLSRIEIHHTYLRCDYHHIVLGDGIASRTQTITVEHTASKTSI